MRPIVGLFAAVLAVFGLSDANGQWQGLCPNGYWAPDASGLGYVCVPNQQQSVCPSNTSYCAAVNLCCNAGFKCASGGCIPTDADDCGNGQYCPAGQKCRTAQGTLVCRSALQAKADDVLNSLGTGIRNWVPDQVERRHEKGLEYVTDNETVKAAVRDFLLSKGLTGVTDEYVSQLLMLAKNSISDVNDFKTGHYYEGIMNITNQASSALLSAIVPWGGTAVDALNIGGAVAAAYAYGFFWGI